MIRSVIGEAKAGDGQNIARFSLNGGKYYFLDNIFAGKFSVSFTLNLPSAPPPPSVPGLVLAVVAVVAGGRQTGLMSRPTYNFEKNIILIHFLFSGEMNPPT